MIGVSTINSQKIFVQFNLQGKMYLCFLGLIIHFSENCSLPMDKIRDFSVSDFFTTDQFESILILILCSASQKVVYKSKQY